MSKFRKKPIVIEAFQITSETRTDNRDWPDWLNRAWNGDRNAEGSVQPFKNGTGTGDLAVVTKEGIMRCSLGDWIIRGVQGELYPCKPDIFAATYDPVDA